MKIRRLKKAKNARIEIIPMIDVMFFLLATFMISSLSLQKLQGINVNLVAGKADSVRKEEGLTLSITKSGEIYLNQKQIAFEEVESEVKKFASSNQEKLDYAVIKADQDSKQGLVMKVMMSARAAGIKHFSILSSDK